MVKMEAANRSFARVVLADNSKFGMVSAITFLDISRACVITDKMTDNKYRDCTVIKEVSI